MQKRSWSPGPCFALCYGMSFAARWIQMAAKRKQSNPWLPLSGWGKPSPLWGRDPTLPLHQSLKVGPIPLATGFKGSRALCSSEKQTQTHHFARVSFLKADRPLPPNRMDGFMPSPLLTSQDVLQPLHLLALWPHLRNGAASAELSACPGAAEEPWCSKERSTKHSPTGCQPPAPSDAHRRVSAPSQPA